MPDINPEIQKEAVKEALKEWLNEQFAAFGKFTFYGLLSAAFAGCVYLWLASHGFKP
jgi:hypothetical protein